MTTACPQLSWQTLQKHDYTSVKKKPSVCANCVRERTGRFRLPLLSERKGGASERLDPGRRQKVETRAEQP